MASNNGIWHKTSVEVVKEQSHMHHTVAGQKRPRAESEHPTAPRPTTLPSHTTHVHRASSLPPAPPKLTASPIISLAVAPQLPSEYSQRRNVPSTPSSSSDPLLALAHPFYGLPRPLVRNLYSLGIKIMYPWQKTCLRGPGLLAGERNLVYSAPTGGGKSLVADVLMLKRVLEDKNAKVLLILPYVALVQEKVRWLRNIVQGVSKPKDEIEDTKRIWRRRADEDSIRVVGFFGGSKIKPTWSDFDIGVCTIEKGNALVNTAIDDCSIKHLKAVVLDELHMIDDDHRGYLMELMGTKLLTLPQPIQIIGMSATMSPAQHASRAVRRVEPSSHKEFQDPVLNAVVSLASETARAGYGALVFASSRYGCENDARWIARVMPTQDELDPDLVEERVDLLAELRSLGTGLDPVLEETVPMGVAFHQERDLIANAYDAGVVKVCIATCSLAAGINLCVLRSEDAVLVPLTESRPARRVILHNARMGRDFVGPSMLRQMRGRAGRKGKDEVGETYLCCRKDDLEQVVELMHAEMPHITSGLMTDKQRIQRSERRRRLSTLLGLTDSRALLEVIAVRLATSKCALDEYVSKTLLSHSGSLDSLRSCVEASLQTLQTSNFVTTDVSGNYQPTKLGKAIVASALDPDDGVFIHKELERALQAFVMDGEMHILYTFTPVQDFGHNINWRVFRNEMENLDGSGHRVLGFLGLKRAVINRLAQGSTLKETTAEEKETARVHRRFYMAFQLRDLCNEMPIHAVARKYDVPRGAVQTLSQTCHGFAAGMIKFCQHMGWG
ncbi:DNA polymerase theta [Colletotrichum tanaceti]|uniref:DNA polymerase theta n=1 Tax=Colletotrichum tanaceti TaxID=1306861 RepID=A0A4U6XP80_9PEZI|nr:DNA polymerase theta [Colletotrichum tanaceti]TKW57562.1 DNA polymerase theta [Colletotrichum tanaceti]